MKVAATKATTERFIGVKMKNIISTVIITRNEEKNIAAAVKSAIGLGEVIVVDSGSTDKTVKAAKEAGARVFTRKWTGYTDQKNFGISKAKGKWVLSIDADERVTPALAEEIVKAVKADAADGYLIPFRHNYYGKFLRWGGLYPDYHLRFFKKSKGRFKKAELHEAVELKGKEGKLKGDILHYTKATIREHVDAVNYYTTLEAKRAGKRVPTGYSMLIKPQLYFFKHYFLKLGFLDGFHGLVYQSISAYYRFITEVKLAEVTGMSKIRLFSTIFRRSK